MESHNLEKLKAMRYPPKSEVRQNPTPEPDKLLLSRLGELIQKRRQQIGFSQEQLCAVTEMNRTYLSDIERGVSNPSFLVLWKLSLALKLELWELLKELNSSQ
jgi:ribosome-binding protein aMBF1 (putative translation factor)